MWEFYCKFAAPICMHIHRGGCHERGAALPKLTVMRCRLHSLLIIVLALCTACPLAVQAQQDEELQYTKEIGAGVGMGFVLGDLNNKWYGDVHPSADLLLRFVLSPRMAVKTELDYTMLKGSTDGVRDFYPVMDGQASAARLVHSASGTLIDLNALYELHFLPYGWYRNYLGHKRVSPYVQVGLGLLYAHTSGQTNDAPTRDNAFNVNIPIGIGLKWKVARRVNLGLDWTMHFTLCDKLDGLSNPAFIQTGGFRGKDFYSKTMLTLTYDISPKCPTCNKAE